MFSVQTVHNAEDEVHPVDVQCANEVQSISEMTSHDLGEHNIGQGENHSLEQVKTDATSVQGSYVSLLADIATIEQSDDYSHEQIVHDMPSSVDYANSSYTGQEQIQALTESDLSSSLQNDNLVSYQPVQNQNIGYNLNNPGGTATALQQYVIIQPIVSSFFTENSASGSSTLIHLPNTSDNQLSLESNKELEDAVANITEKAAGDTEELPNNEVSAEKSFLVSTNRRGEVRDIQVVHGNQSVVLPMGDADISVYKRKSQKSLKKKPKTNSFSKRKEYSSHLKKFSLDDLNSTGKTKKEVFEEYLEKSKVKNEAQDKVKGKDVHSNNENISFINEQSEVTAENEKFVADFSGVVYEVESEGAFKLSKQFHTNEGSAELNLDKLEENIHSNCDIESETVEVIKCSTESEHLSQDVVVNEQAETSCVKEDKTQVSLKAKTVNTDTKIKTRSKSLAVTEASRSKTRRQVMKEKVETHERRTRKQSKDLKANMQLGKELDMHQNVAMKRKKQMPHELKKSRKLPKLVEVSDESDSGEDIIETRVLEDFCTFLEFENRCVLHLEPVTLKLIKSKKLLVIEMEVENDFTVSSIEKGASTNGFTKHYVNLSLPEIDDKDNGNKSLQLKQQKLENKYTKKSTSVRNVKEKVNKETRKSHVSIPDSEPANENVISSLKVELDGKLDEIENLENDINLSDTEILDTHEDVQFDSTQIKSNSQSTVDESKPNAETDTCNKNKNKVSNTAAKSKQKKGGRSAEQRQEGEEKSIKKDIQEDASQKNYTVVLSEEGTRMFMCPVCGYTSKYPSNARKHIYEHTATKDWICEICGMSFKSNNNLQQHQYVHQKDRPFPCPLCPQKFKSNSVLKQHIQRHIGLKAYVCEYCSKEFVTKGDLNKHTRAHTGTTPYHCKDCEKQFADISSLYRHTAQKHSAAQLYVCSICNQQYTYKLSALSHLKKCHSDTIVGTNREKLESLLTSVQIMNGDLPATDDVHIQMSCENLQTDELGSIVDSVTIL